MRRSQKTIREAHRNWSAVWVSFFGFFGGVLGGILTWFSTDFVALKQELVFAASRAIDTTEYRQGSGSLVWDFNLQPERRYVFSSTETIGGFVHFEAVGDSAGVVSGADWRSYSAIRFFAKASAELLSVKEVNLFVGPDFVQYSLSQRKPLILETRWREYTIPLSEFTPAPWETRYRGDLVAKTTRNGVIDLSNVTAFGFDQKTAAERLIYRVWLDYVRLIDSKGNETVLCDEDVLEFTHQGRSFRWIAGARRYP